MAEEKYRDLTFKQWIMQPESMIGISALILSLCGLFISFYEASLIREYQRASVWPNIEIAPSFQAGQAFFHIRNAGIGPARIKAANVTYKGNLLRNWEELIQKIYGNKPLQKFRQQKIDFYTSYIANSVIPYNSGRQNIFGIYQVDSAKTGDKILETFRNEVEAGNINISVCYCSVYEECWVTKMLDKSNKGGNYVEGSNRKVESCKEVPKSNI